jgi:hypothetical protein
VAGTQVSKGEVLDPPTANAHRWAVQAKIESKGKLKIIGRTIISLVLATIIVTACNGLVATPTMSPTGVVARGITLAKTEVVNTQSVNIPPGISLQQFMATRLPSTQHPIPTMTSSPTPMRVTPTVIAMENGITWTECIAPNLDYAHSVPDFEFAASCLQGELPRWNDQDLKIAGERIGEPIIDADLQQIIGNDVYVVKQYNPNGCCDYEFLKNGNVVIKISAPSITFNPNQHLWNIGGKVVWELVADPPTIFVDGVDFNQKYQWEGIYKPYSINDKLLYIAKKNDKFNIVYDEEIIGPAFDEVYIKYCCGTTDVHYGSGQYWFWGKREGIYYVVALR